MDVEKIKAALQGLIRRHRTVFERLSGRETQLLEIGALVLAAEHYKSHGYVVRMDNLQANRFRVKLGSRGKPFNFSWYAVSRGEEKFEIHSNLPVVGAHNDGGIYVVDVAVVKAGGLPPPTKRELRRDWKAMENDVLVTFIEVKKLVVYPMLLAQFYGIVHEIKPAFVETQAADNADHFYPALVSIGYLSATSVQIRDGYKKRGFRLNVIPTFDDYISRIAAHPNEPSPFLPGRPCATQKQHFETVMPPSQLPCPAALPSSN